MIRRAIMAIVISTMDTILPGEFHVISRWIVEKKLDWRSCRRLSGFWNGYVSGKIIIIIITVSFLFENIPNVLLYSFYLLSLRGINPPNVFFILFRSVGYCIPIHLRWEGYYLFTLASNNIAFQRDESAEWDTICFLNTLFLRFMFIPSWKKY